MLYIFVALSGEQVERKIYADKFQSLFYSKLQSAIFQNEINTCIVTTRSFSAKTPEGDFFSHLVRVFSIGLINCEGSYNIFERVSTT